MQDIQVVVLIVKQVFIYQIPPRTTARGYKAGDWDVEKFIFSGRLRVLQQAKSCTILIEDATNGQLFASCPYTSNSNSVEQVTDSSRYFVLRIVDLTTGQHAFVGLGFPERAWAFDFQVALQDFEKKITAATDAKSSNSSAPIVDAPKIDFSLKQGQSLNINIGKLGTEKKAPKITENNDLSAFVIAPPPSNKNVKSNQQTSSDWVKFK